jgi:hypothetical protein
LAKTFKATNDEIVVRGLSDVKEVSLGDSIHILDWVMDPLAITATVRLRNKDGATSREKDTARNE